MISRARSERMKYAFICRRAKYITVIFFLEKKKQASSLGMYFKIVFKYAELFFFYQNQLLVLEILCRKVIITYLHLASLYEWILGEGINIEILLHIFLMIAM